MKTVLLDVKENMELLVNEDTQFVLNFPSNKQEVNCGLNLTFNKEGVSAEVIGLYNLNKGEKMKLRTASVHKVPGTSCLTKIKGVLHDESASDFEGKIIIEKNAQLTNSFLYDNVLVLGEGTKNNSSPILKIDANDVKASHASTTGRVDEETLYYLMSRGLSRNDAESLVIQGFFESLLKEVRDEKIREKVTKSL